MPTGKMRNLVYRLALPLIAPSPKNQSAHRTIGRPLANLPGYERLLVRHHVLGASLLLTQNDAQSHVLSSTLTAPVHTAAPDTLFRVASITKTATALVTLMLCDEGAFTLDTPVSSLLPGGDVPALTGVTVRHLLSHTSGLRDTAAYDHAVQNGDTFHSVLSDSRVHASVPGTTFAYCNFGFGLLGCILEQATNQTVDALFKEKLFGPLGMRAALDATTLDAARIMPISRVLRYHAGQDVTITPLGRIPLTAPDPERHFGHTAGSMYTDAASIARMLSLIADHGVYNGRQLVSAEMIREMTREQAAYGSISPTLKYGLGLLIIEDRSISNHRILGHQGYAYGCADGAFYEEGTGRQVIFLNGGCSEARTGRLGLCNRDVLRWALNKELPSWK